MSSLTSKFYKSPQTAAPSGGDMKRGKEEPKNQDNEVHTDKRETPEQRPVDRPPSPEQTEEGGGWDGDEWEV